MIKVCTLSEAVEKYVHDGDHLATGGFTTSRKPLAAVSEIIRQGKKDLVGLGGPASSDWDMLIGAGLVKCYINCYTANPRFSNVCRRFRDAVENDKIQCEDYSMDAVMMMFHASALGLPYVPVKMMLGSGMEKDWGIAEEARRLIEKLPDKKFIIQDNPFNPGEKLLLLPTPRLDVAIIHVQVASFDGTCRIFGDPYQDIDIAYAAKHTIVTCEQLVTDEEIRKNVELNSIPGIVVDAIVHLPYGAHPSQVYGLYDYDKQFFHDYDKAGKSDEAFRAFLDEWVYGVENHKAYLDKLGASRLLDMSVVPGFGYHVDMTQLAKERMQHDLF